MEYEEFLDYLIRASLEKLLDRFTSKAYEKLS